MCRTAQHVSLIPTLVFLLHSLRSLSLSLSLCMCVYVCSFVCVCVYKGSIAVSRNRCACGHACTRSMNVCTSTCASCTHAGASMHVVVRVHYVDCPPWATIMLRVQYVCTCAYLCVYVRSLSLSLSLSLSVHTCIHTHTHTHMKSGANTTRQGARAGEERGTDAHSHARQPT